jgi:hypothetical protein
VPVAAATPWEYAVPSQVVRTEISGMVIEAIPGPYRPGSACAVFCGDLRDTLTAAGPGNGRPVRGSSQLCLLLEGAVASDGANSDGAKPLTCGLRPAD